MRRFMFILALSAAAGLMAAQPALACGGLVAPNGAVQLQHTTTLAAYHDGVEHYVTSFQYAGSQTEFGAIIPLPGVPTDVRRAGSWTLQRLERETHPPVEAVGGSGRFATAAAAAPAQVLLQTTVDALDITVLSGRGDAVLTWVKDHGYAVSPDAPAMFDFYGRRSPVFLAARFNAARAQARQQLVGDGTPVQITIPTASPWVPLHILSLAKGAAAPVQADVYLLTDRAPALLGLDPGVTVQASQGASASLLADLRSDKDSGWVPDRAWLTFIGIDTSAGRLNHDLAIDPSGARKPSPIQAGFDPAGRLPSVLMAGQRPIPQPSRPISPTRIALIAGLALAALILISAIVVITSGRRPTSVI